MDMIAEGTPTFRLEKVVQAPQEVMEDFEGPLDLILFLLGKNKIAIEDLQITLLCGQFNAWIEARRTLDMEVASDFIAMASHLVYLKSKNLVAAGEGDGEIDLLKQALEERLALEERQKMEVIRDFLGERAELYRLLLTKPPEPSGRYEGYAHIHTADMLSEAIARLLERSEFRRPPPAALFSGIVGREPYPVRAMIEAVRARLEDTGRLTLETLFLSAGSRSGVVAAFLAVLEMCRNREVDLVEEGGAWSVMRSRQP
ncbi:MAG: segregation/condensation protein A [Oscillospiraceae bacterium]|jgi:segregation and condensation protein A|nr:segregation/condensation protein A [Oscillospiraceae bacterium]